MQVVILAAGQGRRLGLSSPKSLAPLSSETTILHRLVQQLSSLGIPFSQIWITVGYKEKEVRVALPREIQFVNCTNYENENTAKSLLHAMNQLPPDNRNILWINGDVVVHNIALEKMVHLNQASMMVDKGPVGEEEVKYRLEEGKIVQVSKELEEACGEALGINFMPQKCFSLFGDCLEQCKIEDYFEKALELCIEKGMTILPVIVDREFCVEVDFPDDLELARQKIRSWAD